MYIPTPKMGNTYPTNGTYRNNICPSNQAASYPAYPLLAEWSQMGCPAMTGNNGQKPNSSLQSNVDPISQPLAPKQSSILLLKQERK